MDHWSTHIRYTSTNDTVPKLLRIRFLPTGDIDTSLTAQSDLVMGARLLSPVTSQFRSIATAQGVDLDFWKCMNWLIVSWYWIFLADLGQDSPLTYYWPVLQMPWLSAPDFSKPFQHSATNNIFINETLFSIYSDFMRKQILPFLKINATTAEFAPLHDSFIFPPTSLMRSYNCIERRLKPPFTAIFSIVVADYAFIMGGFSLFLFISSWYQKRTGRGKSIFAAILTGSKLL